ncbi:hypothetical protein [Streptomyces sp. NPDC054794]
MKTVLRALATALVLLVAVPATAQALTSPATEPAAVTTTGSSPDGNIWG